MTGIVSLLISIALTTFEANNEFFEDTKMCPMLSFSIKNLSIYLYVVSKSSIPLPSFISNPETY